MGAPGQLHDLVERFDRNLDAYKSGDYNETQARGDFIDPLMGLLGWDVHNRQGKSPAYRDVIEEDRVKVGGGTKAPDYGFYAGGTRRFFLEAKKPSVDIAGDLAPAVQLRRYAWSAKLPLSILTDFEEFAVYDCRFEPVKEDKPATARLEFMTFDQYVDRWDDIEGLFSREAVLGGSLEKYAEANRKKRGTETVDAAFLREIEGWRDALARDLAARNGLNTRQLNYAVQMTIDRLIFLRMAEDRGIEEYGKLLGLTNGAGVYGRLVERFRDADDRYNSGLFHFRNERGRGGEPDGLTPNLEIDDGVLAGIVRGLYYPESPYEFSVLPVDVLGQVYEQFLGSVIHLSDDGHEAVVEQKPEVRKAGGVYYTPTYIVDYIVQNTVGKLLEGKKPGPRGGASKLKIVDPACGSGSFLIGAYEYLLDWHRDRYLEDGPEKHRDRLHEGPGGQWRLTIDEKKRILLNNIHGVDIDPQAVEVTKLSLLIKVLEGESEQSLQTQLRMFQERALPDLSANIKCGNSLIGPDFYAEQDMALFEEEDHYRINVFDWRKAFPQVFDGENPGFDAVIGNPPYGAEFLQYASKYFENRYETFVWRGESYLLFVEKALSALRQSGFLGFIIPDTYLNLGFTQSLRTLLLQKTKVIEVFLLPSNVFSGATVDTTLLTVERANKVETFHETDIAVKTMSKKSSLMDMSKSHRQFSIPAKFWYEQRAFNVQSNEEETKLFTKVEKQNYALSNFAEMFSGVKAYEVGKGKPPQTKEVRDTKPYTSKTKVDSTFLPLFDGKHVGRYELFWRQNNWLKYGPWLAAPRKSEHFEGEKILIRKIVDQTLVSTYVPYTSYCNTLLFILKTKQSANLSYRYILGILNSQFIGWFFRKKFQISAEDTFPQIMIRDILQFPIPEVYGERHEKMVGLVERMQALHEKLAEARIERERTVIGHQISATDRQIDNLVYELYGLTGEEIRIVEEATA